MQVITAPDDAVPHHTTLFLAGGITNCPDWQADTLHHLKDLPITVYNPRRPNFPIKDPLAAEKQILWEYRALCASDVISFWFCAETLNPIVLFELGSWLRSPKPLFIGCHPGYSRIKDVVIQTGLVRPKQVVTVSVDPTPMVEHLKTYLKSVEVGA